jgi:hypothetical protein
MAAEMDALRPSHARPTRRGQYVTTKKKYNFLSLIATSLLLTSGVVSSASGQTLQDLKNPDTDEGLSSGGSAALFGPYTGPGNNNPNPGYHDNGRGGNSYVNDPCLDPPPPGRARTVQSEDEIATFGKYMVVGYNDSYGFYDNRQGLSGFSYSINGGNTWVDGGGLPPVVPGAAGDRYYGDPVLVVDKSARTFTVGGAATSQAAGEFYYSSIYQLPNGTFSLSVNRGRFQTAPPQTPESVATTRCAKDPTLFGVPNTKNLPTERIVWERPSVAVPVTNPDDFLDKEWLYVNQANGELYLTYTRFGADGSTPLELVRSFDGGRTWTPPTVIVPNLNDTFNQATQPAVTSTGRVIVVYYARTFSANGSGPESEDHIDYAFSDDDGVTFQTKKIQDVNPQGEPPGYNRGRRSILNTPFINTYPHGTDVYVTYFSGKTPVQAPPYSSNGDIYVASSHDNGNTFIPVKVNDDSGLSSHVFPSVQVNKLGDVYVGWLDRRYDPSNALTDQWANVSKDGGATFGHDKVQTDVATDWFVRADARPNFGDYNSSELLNDNQFLLVWSDGRFPPPAPTPQAATPDTIFTIANGLGTGGGNP